MRKIDHSMVRQLMPWTAAIVVLCALDPEAALQGLVQTLPNLAVPATALGLTLITAANKDGR
jgi:hypothetical protein